MAKHYSDSLAIVPVKIIEKLSRHFYFIYAKYLKMARLISPVLNYLRHLWYNGEKGGIHEGIFL